MREKSRVRKRRACRVIPELDSSYVPCAGARSFCPSTPAPATSGHTSRLMRLPPACRGDAGNELNMARSLAQSQRGLLLNRSGPLLRNRLSRRCRRVETIGVRRGCSTSGASCAGPRKQRHPDQSRRTAHDAIRGGRIAKRAGTKSIVRIPGAGHWQRCGGFMLESRLSSRNWAKNGRLWVAANGRDWRFGLLTFVIGEEGVLLRLVLCGFDKIFW